MKPSYKTKSVLVYDYGLFQHVATKLAESFGSVMYYVPNESPYPKPNIEYIGVGLAGVERVYDLWARIEESDLIVFPDVRSGGMQTYLRKLGYRVWGSGYAERLELERESAKDILAQLGMPVAGWRTIKGVQKLREYLKANKNKYVKIDGRFRGLKETFSAQDYRSCEPDLDEIEWHLGKAKGLMEFHVEDEIKTTLELGYDGFTVDGNYAKSAGIYGAEIKDCAYLGAVMPYDSLPDPLVYCNAKLAGVFDNYDYRGFYSTEIRVDKAGRYFLTDFTQRAGSPPSESYVEVYKNWDEIMYEGAAGKLIEPISEKSYIAQAIIVSEWARNNWQVVKYPDAIKRWIKLKYSCVIDGENCVIPQDFQNNIVGWVTAMGDSVIEAVSNLKQYADQIEGRSLEVKIDSISKGVTELKEAEDRGFKFGMDILPEADEIARILQ